MTTMDATRGFAQSYAEARALFLAAADAAGLDVESHPHPMLGADGEPLALDVAHDGRRDAARLLIVSSGCHGVEGFGGSGAQVALLGNAALRQTAHEAGVALLHLHALNPYGFSWWRRTTHENVDLNRNFRDFSQPLPPNPAYDEIAPLLLPPTWPPSQAVTQRLGLLLRERGLAALQAAVSGGQYSDPDGLFYGGRNPCWSHVTLRHVLHEHGLRCRALGWIDLHTGLGPLGHGEKIHAGPDGSVAIGRARAWWGADVTSVADGSSSSARLQGPMWTAAPEECPQAEVTAIALEFGTVPLLEMFDALRADQWIENHPEAPPAQRLPIKRRLRDVFYVDTAEWKQAVVEQTRDAVTQAIAGLAMSG